MKKGVGNSYNFRAIFKLSPRFFSVPRNMFGPKVGAGYFYFLIAVTARLLSTGSAPASCILCLTSFYPHNGSV